MLHSFMYIIYLFSCKNFYLFYLFVSSFIVQFVLLLYNKKYLSFDRLSVYRKVYQDSPSDIEGFMLIIISWNIVFDRLKVNGLVITEFLLCVLARISLLFISRLSIKSCKFLPPKLAIT